MIDATIYHVRGDTLEFAFEPIDFPVSDVVSLAFTVKDKGSDAEPIIQKTIGDGITLVDEHYSIRVDPEDTETAQYGVYVHDLELGVGEDIFTMMLGEFRIVQDVTFEE